MGKFVSEGVGGIVVRYAGGDGRGVLRGRKVIV